MSVRLPRFPLLSFERFIFFPNSPFFNNNVRGDFHQVKFSLSQRTNNRRMIWVRLGSGIGRGLHTSKTCRNTHSNWKSWDCGVGPNPKIDFWDTSKQDSSLWFSSSTPACHYQVINNSGHFNKLKTFKPASFHPLHYIFTSTTWQNLLFHFFIDIFLSSAIRFRGFID